LLDLRLNSDYFNFLDLVILMLKLNLKFKEYQMRIALAVCLMLLMPVILMAEEMEILDSGLGYRYAADRFIVVTNSNTPPLETNELVAGIAYTGVNSIDNLCAQYDVVSVDLFYPYPLKSQV